MPVTTIQRTATPDLNKMSCLAITLYYNNKFGEKNGDYSILLSIFYSIFGCCTGSDTTRRVEILKATKKELFSPHHGLMRLDIPKRLQNVKKLY